MRIVLIGMADWFDFRANQNHTGIVAVGDSPGIEVTPAYEGMSFMLDERLRTIPSKNEWDRYSPEYPDYRVVERQYAAIMRLEDIRVNRYMVHSAETMSDLMRVMGLDTLSFNDLINQRYPREWGP